MGYKIGPTLAVGGESEYNAAMKRIRESMKYVQAEANAATSAFDKNDRSIESLTAQNANLKKSLDLQADAVKAAEDALQRMINEGVDPSSTAYKRMEANLNNAKATMNQTKGEIKNNAEEIKNLGKKTNTVKDQIKDFAKSSVVQFASISGAIALAVKAAKALWEAFDEAADWADDLDTLSAQTGIATDTLQELSYASRFVDVSMEDMQKGLAKVVDAYNDANLKGQDYIEVATGVTVSTIDMAGASKSSEQLFYDVVDALGAMNDATLREAAAQEIFGRSYQDIMPLIKAGSGALQEYADEANETDVVLSQGLVLALQKLDDAMERSAAKTEANARRTAASLSSVGLKIADLKTVINNFIPDLMNLSLNIGRVISGVSDEGIDTITDLEIGAEAAGLTVEEFSESVSDLAYVLLLASDEAKTYAEAYDEAFGLVAQGMDEVTYARDTMTAAQKKWDQEVADAAANYVAKAEEYQAAVTSLTATYMQEMGGLFDAFPEQAEVSMQTLLDNLESQVVGFEQWASDIETLAARGVDEGLIQQLRDAGPEAAGEVHALAAATDEELGDYVDLWQEKGEAAESAAVDALEPMAEEVDAALQEVEDVVAAETEAMEELGEQLGRGIGDGFDASTSYIVQSAEDAIEAALEAARSAAGIASPSKLMRDEVGLYLGEGTGIGFLEGLQAMIPKMQEGITGMTDTLSAPTDRRITLNNTFTFGGSYSERDGAAIVRSINRQLGELYA